MLLKPSTPRRRKLLLLYSKFQNFLGRVWPQTVLLAFILEKITKILRWVPKIFCAAWEMFDASKRIAAFAAMQIPPL